MVIVFLEEKEVGIELQAFLFCWFVAVVVVIFYFFYLLTLLKRPIILGVGPIEWCEVEQSVRRAFENQVRVKTKL
jgi:hypothetical protein